MEQPVGAVAASIQQEGNLPVELDWRIPADFMPEGLDDPWLRIEVSDEPDRYPVPAGYP